MKIYYAKTLGPVDVIEGKSKRPLLQRRDLRRLSEGFAWGCKWAACDQLSLAILCDVFDDEKALRLYQRFKERAILPKHRDEPFEMTLDEILAVVEAIEKENTP